MKQSDSCSTFNLKIIQEENTVYNMNRILGFSSLPSLTCLVPLLQIPCCPTLIHNILLKLISSDNIPRAITSTAGSPCLKPSGTVSRHVSSTSKLLAHHLYQFSVLKGPTAGWIFSIPAFLLLERNFKVVLLMILYNFFFFGYGEKRNIKNLKLGNI